MSDVILVEYDGSVGRLVINRPEARNAITIDVIDGLLAGIEKLEASADTRVIVLTGAGEKAFCAGGDMRIDPSAGFLAIHEGRGKYAQLIRRMQECGKPLVARVNGHALGGGLGLALACDIVVAGQNAAFGTPEVKLGLFPMMIMALLVKHVPRKKLVEMMLTGQRVSASEAVQLGMANYAVAPDKLDEKTHEITTALAGKSSAILRLGKTAFHTMEDMSTDQALSYLHGMLTVNAMSEDAMEGVMAFMEKREANWKDK